MNARTWLRMRVLAGSLLAVVALVYLGVRQLTGSPRPAQAAGLLLATVCAAAVIWVRLSIGVYLPWLNLMSEQPNRLKGVFTATEIPLKETHKKELIYDGKTDDVIKITYLEFGEDFTHPPAPEFLL